MLGIDPNVRIVRRKEDVVYQPFLRKISTSMEDVLSIRIRAKVVMDTVLIKFVRILKMLPADTVFDCNGAADKGTDEQYEARHNGCNIVY